MATLVGNDGLIKIDNASGTLTEVVSVRNFSVDITSDTIETTTMQQSQRTYVKGLSSWSGSADIYFNTDNYTGGANPIAALNPTGVSVGASTVTVELYLDNPGKKFGGEAIITGFTVNSSMDGMVEASIAFQGSGTCTFTL